MRFLRGGFLGLLLWLCLAGTIDLANLFGYSSQEVPAYIARDNSPVDNPITDLGATLGRVLFYDKALSLNYTVACATCHQQQFAFSDTARQSVGFDGDVTGRHSMRLINIRFAEDPRAFWNERAPSIEAQTTQPIQDHAEMGFSGSGNQPALDSLLRRLQELEHYQTLFPLVFGDSTITEDRLQKALSQFLRSIQSFDSRFDEGMAQALSLQTPFPTFTQSENIGKAIFLRPVQRGGCQGCHRAPEFDIDPLTHNNGVVGNLLNPADQDLSNTRAPTLRDLVGPNGTINGPIMHDGSLNSLLDVVNHYDSIPSNMGLDQRLRGANGLGQIINYSPDDKANLVAFLETLTSENVYTEMAYSDPFEPDGSISLTGSSRTVTALGNLRFTAYPNPATDWVKLDLPQGDFVYTLFDTQGRQVLEGRCSDASAQLDIHNLEAGSYLVQVRQQGGKQYGRSWLLVAKE